MRVVGSSVRNQPMYTVLPEPGGPIMRITYCPILDVRDEAITPGTGGAFQGQGKGPTTQPIQSSSRASAWASVARHNAAKAFPKGIYSDRPAVYGTGGCRFESCHACSLPLTRPATYGWPCFWSKTALACIGLPWPADPPPPPEGASPLPEY